MMSSCCIIHSHPDVTCHIIKSTPTSKEFGEILNIFDHAKIFKFLLMLCCAFVYQFYSYAHVFILSIFNGKAWSTAKECQTTGTYTSTSSWQKRWQP